MQNLHRSLVVLITVLITFSPVCAQREAGFLVKFRDEVTPLSVTGVFLQPGEEINIETLFEDTDHRYKLTASAGTSQEIRNNVWKYKAPTEKGVYTIVIEHLEGERSMTLNCIVMLPYSALKDGQINGYRIGSYPSSKSKIYTLPRGFIEVTKENQNTKVSPSYTLKDFLCKQKSDWPKYVVLRERGILKLETVQSFLKTQDIEFSRFSFISGYRTPYYNKSIGNVKFSRHVFGDAFDVFIDSDKDGRFDDINGDGKQDKKDALHLYNLVNRMYEQPWYKPFIGGMGLYGANSRHAAFIHLDSRGSRARWGL